MFKFAWVSTQVTQLDDRTNRLVTGTHTSNSMYCHLASLQQCSLRAYELLWSFSSEVRTSGRSTRVRSLNVRSTPNVHPIYCVPRHRFTFMNWLSDSSVAYLSRILALRPLSPRVNRRCTFVDLRALVVPCVTEALVRTIFKQDTLIGSPPRFLPFHLLDNPTFVLQTSARVPLKGENKKMNRIFGDDNGHDLSCSPVDR